MQAGDCPRSWPEGKEQPSQWANPQPWVPQACRAARQASADTRRRGGGLAFTLRSVPASHTKSEQDYLPAHPNDQDAHEPIG